MMWRTWNNEQWVESLAHVDQRLLTPQQLEIIYGVEALRKADMYGDPLLVRLIQHMLCWASLRRWVPMYRYNQISHHN